MAVEEDLHNLIKKSNKLSEMEKSKVNRQLSTIKSRQSGSQQAFMTLKSRGTIKASDYKSPSSQVAHGSIQ